MILPTNLETKKRKIEISSFVDEDGNLTVFASLEKREIARLIYDLDGQFVRDIEVDPLHRRNGVAWSLYDWLEQHGHFVNASKFQTPDGMSFWNARNGIRKRTSLNSQ